jgi:putative CocE/NonD family hydrolase
MFAGVGGANFYQEFGHPGGATNLGWPLWLARSAQTSPQAAGHAAEAEALAQMLKEPSAWLGMHPKEREKVFEKFPAHLEMYRDFYGHPTFDHYWQQRGFDIRGHHGEMKDVPTLFVSGWYDYFSAGVLENFAALSEIQQSGKKLIMGPWWHATGGDTCGDASFAQASQMDETAIMLGWFDHWLKQEPMEDVPSSAVSFDRMGGGEGGRDADGLLRHGGEWLSASSWPPEDVAPARWYLRSGGQLAQQKPGQQQPDSYVFDPDHPVPTIGGRFAMGPWSPRCVQDQVCKLDYLGCEDAKPLAERSDVLVYQTEPLDAEIEVTGPISATLWVSSDRVDTDFTAKLIDVHPDGYAMILAEGQIRARYPMPPAAPRCHLPRRCACRRRRPRPHRRGASPGIPVPPQRRRPLRAPHLRSLRSLPEPPAARARGLRPARPCGRSCRRAWRRRSPHYLRGLQQVSVFAGRR